MGSGLERFHLTFHLYELPNSFLAAAGDFEA
jgi:hypothetical protein